MSKIADIKNIPQYSILDNIAIDAEIDKNDYNILKDILTPENAEKMNCSTEMCIISKTHLLPDEEKARLLAKYKINGPRDNKLLSNKNIDTILLQWAEIFDDFFAYNFNMRNFKKYSFDPKVGAVEKPDTLSSIPFSMVYRGLVSRESNGNYVFEKTDKKYRCGACVINTDTYQGAGKHWMALFVDARTNNWTIEFFNSSGNSPTREWTEWMTATKNDLTALQAELGIAGSVESVVVNNIEQQLSKTECGVYSLFYIWMRLNGEPWTYFKNHVIIDQYMFLMRQYLFYEDTFIHNFLKSLFYEKDFVTIFRDKINKSKKYANIAKKMSATNSSIMDNIGELLQDNAFVFELVGLIRADKDLVPFIYFDFNKYTQLVDVTWNKSDYTKINLKKSLK